MEEEFDLAQELRWAYREQTKLAANMLFDGLPEESESMQLRANLMILAAEALEAANA